jgi:hypothetical protein
MSTDAGNVGFPPDLVITKKRQLTGGATFMDRLRGNNRALLSSGIAIEATVNSVGVQFNSDTNVGVDINGGAGTSSWVAYCFKRATGFMDVVCYTRTTASPQTINHNLTVLPELVICKEATGTTWGWCVASSKTIIGSEPWYADLRLNTNAAAAGQQGATIALASSVTTSSFASYFGATGVTCIAYLFATLAGISKVGSYTGNGSSQTIACGFAAGSRFVMIKRTDSTGDWYVWDTSMGILAANDPHLSLNTVASQVLTDDSIDPNSTGFIVNQVAATNINVTSATYIFLAIA